VPEILGVFRDDGVSAHEFIVERRLPGEMLDRRVREITSDVLGGVLVQMARLAARWHTADPGALVARPPRTHPAEAFVDELLREHGPRHVDVEMTPTERKRFDDVLDRVRALPPVLVHTDLHEGQLLVDRSLRLTGVLDWQTARVGHPFTEFDLGEWGTGAWRAHHSDFPALRRRMWKAYATARSFEDDLVDEFAIFWAVVQAHRWPMSVHVGSDVTGTSEDTLAAMHDAFAT
jgi:aminoglycoside phosphotransferase (APT) family kinase protein